MLAREYAGLASFWRVSWRKTQEASYTGFFDLSSRDRGRGLFQTSPLYLNNKGGD